MASTSTVDDTLIETEEIITNLAKSKPSGFTHKDISTNHPTLSSDVIVKCLNKLLKMGCLVLYKEGNNLVYKYKDTSKVPLTKCSDSEEKVVFGIIGEAGNKGIWIRDIRVKSNLLMTQLNKVLKSLESKKLIKAVKSVSATKKKVYMLYNLEPDKSITGGSWYQDQDFEAEFVEVLNEQCHRYLLKRKDDVKAISAGPLVARNNSFVNVKDVHKYIQDLGISKVSLSINDLESILYTLVLDGKAERIPTGSSFLYRACNNLIVKTGYSNSVCGRCPVFHRCSTIGHITSLKCPHMHKFFIEDIEEASDFTT